MSSRNSALASLTAQYTDSENEEDNNSDDDNNSDGSTESQVIIPLPKLSDSPLKPPSDSSTPPTTGRPKKSLRLVSYNDDAIISDEENVSPNHDESIHMEISEEEAEEVPKEDTETKRDKYADYGFCLPPEPKGKCPSELFDKINNLYEKMKNANMDMNKIIQERKDFRNPSIYEKLIQFCDIDELGTNYPPEIYDPKQWGKESYYEDLANAQKLEMEKREKERKENNNKTEIITSVKKLEDDPKKRKSKWDQPGTSATQNNLKPAGLIQPSLTSSLTSSSLTSSITGKKGNENDFDDTNLLKSRKI